MTHGYIRSQTSWRQLYRRFCGRVLTYHCVCFLQSQRIIFVRFVRMANATICGSPTYYRRTRLWRPQSSHDFLASADFGLDEGVPHLCLRTSS